MQLLHLDRWEAAGRPDLAGSLSHRSPYGDRGARSTLQPLQAKLIRCLPQAAAIRGLQFEPGGMRFSLR
ncbi:hypothetical protein ACVNS2_13135 [Paenibacillus caseinilyticus]|uniref:Uncharacterized protein n=1 Tax=Paenibacillus mucilaginosus K02 TaxID=997761 RepID=I0BGS9_9BACL|nr:hypothetical protein [Paenibacillus mucilaginosus]AFH61576.1 hypothetical protein B2K_12720 [Paenibacillus mucilaginosus K02]